MDAGATAYAYNLCGYRMVQEEDQKEVEQIKLSDIERCVELSSKIEKMRDSDARKILKNQLHSFLGIQPTRKVSSSMDLAYKLGFRPELSVYLHLEKFVASKCEAINPGHGVMGTYYFEDEIEETVREFFNRD